jgi:hypothetical protein
MTDLLTRNRDVAWASESSYGTDPDSGSPSTWFSTLGEGPRVSQQDQVVEDNGVRGEHDGLPHQTFQSHCDVSLEFYLRGKESSAGDAPLWSPVLLAAGFEETINASTDATYDLVTSHTDSVAPAMTVHERQWLNNGDYRSIIATGVRGNLSLQLTADEFAMATFEGRGLYGALDSTDQTGNPSGTYDGGKSPLLTRNMSVSIGGTSYELDELAIDLTNWSINDHRPTSGTSSLDRVELRRGDDSRVGGEMTFKDMAMLDEVLGAYSADSEFALSIELADGTDTLTMTCSSLQFGAYTRNGGPLESFGVPFFLNGPGLALEFT